MKHQRVLYPGASAHGAREGTHTWIVRITRTSSKRFNPPQQALSRYWLQVEHRNQLIVHVDQINGILHSQFCQGEKVEDGKAFMLPHARKLATPYHATHTHTHTHSKWDHPPFTTHRAGHQICS